MDFTVRYEIYHFFKGISDSFHPTPLELTGIILGLSLFLGMFIFVYRCQKRKSREASLNLVQGYFANTVKKLDLPPRQAELLNRIAEAHPADIDKKQVVLQRASIFDEGAGILIESGELTWEEIIPLRQALEEGSFQKDHGIASTGDLPRGIHLYMTGDDPGGRHGEIHLKTPSMMRVELRDDDTAFTEEEEITAYFKRGEDTFYFKSDVIETRPGMLALSHPVKVRKVQRRRYYRRECKKAGVLSKLSGKNRIPTTIIDLGGGGATVLNRDNRFKSGEEVFLYFKIPGQGELRVQGKIVRATAENAQLHVRFEHLKEREREKIISYIFKMPDEAPSRRKQAQ